MVKSNLKQVSLVVALMLSSFTAGLNLQPLLARADGTVGFGVFLKAYDILKSEHLEKLDDTKLVQGAIKGMLEATGDPYTRYMDPQAYQGMKEERTGSFSGIGIQIGVRNNKIHGKEIPSLTVVSPLEDTPAWKAGLQAGDVILEIDTHSTKDMAVDKAVELIKGQRGTSVKLKIYRDSNKNIFDVSIVRDSIVPKIVKFKMMDKNIGYLRLTSFMSSQVPKDMKQAIKELKQDGMKALIFDLRNNPGGLLPNAVSVGSMFVKKGPIVQIVDKKGNKETLDASGTMELPQDLPVVLLVDEGSASASEIVAGALKDNNRATLMGTKTFGKGLVQTVHELEDGSGMAITTNKYLTTKGTDINQKGIEPDIVVEIPKDIIIESPGGKNDIQVNKAMDYLKEVITKKEGTKKATTAKNK